MIFARRALVNGEWLKSVRLTVADGAIEKIVPDSSACPGDVSVDSLLPALANLHSHSFQRAMAGMTERRAVGQDSFWTWRDLMYRFLEKMMPDMVEAVAALVFVEMLEAGYASVGEFHYLHHQPGGVPYDNPAELSLRIMAAAETAGIGLTLLPVLYSYGGAGRKPLAGGQLRFGNTVDQFQKLIEAVRKAAAGNSSDSVIGIAPHSLRAIAPEDVGAIIELAADGPVHMHIAEQPKEVEDIKAWLSARPVEWALHNLPLGPGWCLIHATHMTADETTKLARSGAVAGLCPITEANLGDGPFNGEAFVMAGGAFGIGSDSNVRIALGEELRMLEYSQRLAHLSRNVLVPQEGSVGDFLYREAASGGARALARKAGVIAEGNLADLLAIDSHDPTLEALEDGALIDGLVFAAPPSIVTDVWSAGRHVVQGGRHIRRDEIIAAWRRLRPKLAEGL